MVVYKSDHYLVIDGLNGELCGLGLYTLRMCAKHDDGILSYPYLDIEITSTVSM